MGLMHELFLIYYLIEKHVITQLRGSDILFGEKHVFF